MRVKGGNHNTSLLDLDDNYEILSPCLLVLDLGTVINKFNTLKTWVSIFLHEGSLINKLSNNVDILKDINT